MAIETIVKCERCSAERYLTGGWDNEAACEFVARTEGWLPVNVYEGEILCEKCWKKEQEGEEDE